MAQTRYFASLSSYAILKFVPHTAARCCCNKQQHKTPRAQQYESSGAVRSRKAQCQALPHSPETGDTHDSSSSREEAALCGEKIDNRAAPKKRIQAAQPPPPATRQQATQLLGGTCTSMSASCCCCCRSVLLLLPHRVALIVTKSTRPRRTRHGLSEGRGVA